MAENIEIYDIEGNNEKIEFDKKINQNTSKANESFIYQLLNDAVNFKFKNINNIILFAINCTMPSIPVFFLEKRDVFIQLDFSKLILITFSINIMILYGLIALKYMSGKFSIILLRLRLNYYTMKSEFIKKPKSRRIKLKKAKSGEEEVNKNGLKMHEEINNNYINKINEMNEEINRFEPKYTVNECFISVSNFNIISSLLLIACKILAYCFDIALPDKFWVRLVSSNYLMFNGIFIMKIFLGGILQLISEFINIVVIMSKKLFSKKYKLEIELYKEDSFNAINR